jgi:hypothetical protein
MDKKKKHLLEHQNELKGFEDFIKESPLNEGSSPGKIAAGGNKKNESNFENYTFLTNDAERIHKLNDLLKEKMDFMARFDQSERIIQRQKKDITEIKDKIFLISDREDSPYRKSLAEVFDTFFISNHRETSS